MADGADVGLTSRLFLDRTAMLKLWLGDSSRRSGLEFEFDMNLLTGLEPYFPGGQLLPLADGRTAVKAEFAAGPPGSFDEACLGRGLERDRELRDRIPPGASLAVTAEGASRELRRLLPPQSEGASSPFFTAGSSRGRERLLYLAPAVLSSIRDSRNDMVFLLGRHVEDLASLFLWLNDEDLLAIGRAVRVRCLLNLPSS